MELIVTPNPHVILKKLITSGRKRIERIERIEKIEREALIERVEKGEKEEKGEEREKREYIYITDNNDDEYIFNRYIELDRKFKLKILAPFVFDNIDILDIEYANLDIDLFHAKEDISISNLPETIYKIVMHLRKDYSKFAVLRPSKISSFTDKKLRERNWDNVVFCSHVNDVGKDVDFIIDTMLDNNLSYISLGEALSRIYQCQDKNKEVSYFRLITEETFVRLSKVPCSLIFFSQCHKLLSRYNVSDIESYNKIKSYCLHVRPAIVKYKSSRHPSLDFTSSVTSVILNNPELIIDFIDFGFTHEDNYLDDHNMLEILYFLYPKYGSNLSLNFYLTILQKCHGLSLDEIIYFGRENYINVNKLLRLQFEVYNRFSPKIANNNSRTLKSIEKILQEVYGDRILKMVDESNYVDDNGVNYMINQDSIGLIPSEKIIPLIIKDNIIFLYQRVFD